MNTKYKISNSANAEVMAQVKNYSQYVDSDILDEWKTGIAFLHDFGLISLDQWAELRKMYLD